MLLRMLQLALVHCRLILLLLKLHSLLQLHLLHLLFQHLLGGRVKLLLGWSLWGTLRSACPRGQPLPRCPITTRCPLATLRPFATMRPSATSCPLATRHRTVAGQMARLATFETIRGPRFFVRAIAHEVSSLAAGMADRSASGAFPREVPNLATVFASPLNLWHVLATLTEAV